MDSGSLDTDVLYKAMPSHHGIRMTKTFHHMPKPNIDPSRVNLAGGFVVVVTGASYGIGEFMYKTDPEYLTVVSMLKGFQCESIRPC